MEKLYGRELMKDGCNCAQSVLVSLCGEAGISEEEAMRMACCLGGGCRAGEICGALTGALMALSLVNGNTDRKDNETRMKAYAEFIELDRMFKERFGNLTCRGLLGVDTSTENGHRYMMEHPETKEQNCHEFIDAAIEMARGLMARHK